MVNSFIKLFSLVVLTLIIGSTSAYVQSSKNEDIVRSYIDARNNYNVEKLNMIVDEDYMETFADGSVEIENKAQLTDMVLWGMALDSKIELFDIKSKDKYVITVEEYTNYLDLALNRKSRKFKIIYTLKNNKIHHQKIDTLPGYHQVIRYNWEKNREFEEYCRQNNLRKDQHSLNRASGIELRKILEKYIKDNQ